MALEHKRWDNYRLAIRHVAWVHEKVAALECAAFQAVIVVGKALEEAENQKRKTDLNRMAAMLSRLGGRGYQVRESEEACAAEGERVDPDPDSDLDEIKSQPSGAACRRWRGGK